MIKVCCLPSAFLMDEKLPSLSGAYIYLDGLISTESNLAEWRAR